MKTLLVLCSFLIFGVSNGQGGMIQYRTMIKHLTGYSYSKMFENYGCSCDNRDNVSPEDHVDRCCWRHKCCYKMIGAKCGAEWRPYDYSFEANDLHCDTSSLCKNKICICDMNFAYCLKFQLLHFSWKIRKYDRRKCNQSNSTCPASIQFPAASRLS
ncbi:phospholipase A2, membrane associated-like [Gracilinanus agilis]|uniref:phospholipase A2, membrane associated-like n=1 Tax=Gracilinanus agilis TaxID=191870 RepID=UPI001CFDC612|nr:phospholipase A2, membrane associated-like [Gracilinanus agilis]